MGIRKWGQINSEEPESEIKSIKRNQRSNQRARSNKLRGTRKRDQINSEEPESEIKSTQRNQRARSNQLRRLARPFVRCSTPNPRFTGRFELICFSMIHPPPRPPLPLKSVMWVALLCPCILQSWISCLWSAPPSLRLRRSSVASTERGSWLSKSEGHGWSSTVNTKIPDVCIPLGGNLRIAAESFPQSVPVLSPARALVLLKI